MERGCARIYRAGRDLQCRGGPRVLGFGTDVSHSLGKLKGPQELFAYAVLGVAGGIASLIFSKALGYFRPRLRQLPRWTWYIQPPSRASS